MSGKRLFLWSCKADFLLDDRVDSFHRRSNISFLCIVWFLILLGERWQKARLLVVVLHVYLTCLLFRLIHFIYIQGDVRVSLFNQKELELWRTALHLCSILNTTYCSFWNVHGDLSVALLLSLRFISRYNTIVYILAYALAPSAAITR